MNGDFSAAVDYRGLAGSGATLAERIELARMPRVVAALASDEGAVDAELAFGIDAAGLIVVKGRLSAEVQLTCQRCLDAMRLPVNSRFQVALVENEAEIEALPPGLEPCLVSEQVFEPLRLIEDELLLCLPIVARHAETESCTAPALPEGTSAPAEPAKANPFAVLKDLTSNAIREKD